MMRADVEHERAPKIEEGEPLAIKPNRKFNFEAARQAWAALRVIQREDHIRSHMAMLEKWLGKKL
jgi:hypothetical protein